MASETTPEDFDEMVAFDMLPCKEQLRHTKAAWERDIAETRRANENDKRRLLSMLQFTRTLAFPDIMAEVATDQAVLIRMGTKLAVLRNENEALKREVAMLRRELNLK